MQVTCDVLVIGSGVAGFTAALAAASQGQNVSIVSAGCGTYSISSGCIDLLGQIDKQFVVDPWAAMFKLPEEHPYRLLGHETIRQALKFFTEIIAKQGGYLYHAHDKANNPINTLVPTLMGTFKPTYLIPESLDSIDLFHGKRILLCGVEGLRDISTQLLKHNLTQHEKLKHKHFDTAILPSPDTPHRSFTPLDLARLVDTPAGYTWLTTSLGKYAANYDCVLLPPICGTTTAQSVLQDLNDLLKAKVHEVLSLPPGVGGIRLHALLLKEATEKKIRLLENSKIVESRVEGNICLEVSTMHAPRKLTIQAKAYVLATGGILGGGLMLGPTMAKEPIFQLSQPINPAQMSAPDLFDDQPMAKLGVACDRQLRPYVNADQETLKNVFLAGKIIAGYDYATEKCGHGVAISTGWFAGTLAAKYATQTVRDLA